MKMPPHAGQAPPNPELIFETFNAYQRTAILKAAIELDVFTAIGEGASNPSALAKRCSASERGMRILCDNLAIMGFLTKGDQKYALTPDSSVFLDRRSPACIASVTGFLTMPQMMDSFKDLTAAVRKGGTVLLGEGSVEPDNPLWVEFARSMAALQAFPAEMLADVLNVENAGKCKILDVAAGHGVFGIALAKRNPGAEIFALDWPAVLNVAKENAENAGVAGRYHLLPGNAFDVPLGEGYDLILLTNFLHHFDMATIEPFLRRVHAALAPNGRAITVDFVPNEDRVTPPRTASFSVIMLASTRAGDAYTFAEYNRMFRNAGFSSSEHRPLAAGPQSIIISRK
jgi:ubiquinone/menaquinone biosynthesis C-methylase UbiE